MKIKLLIAATAVVMAVFTIPPIMSADDERTVCEQQITARAETVQITQEPETQPEEQPEEHIYTDADIKMLARLIYGEGRGTETIQQAAVVWCVLNRVESEDFPDTISEVITQKNQFAGYSLSFPVEPQFESLALDVLQRWEAELSGQQSVGRVLPKEYLYFTGDGIYNHFRTDYKADTAVYWNWDCENPYMEE